MTPKPRKKRYSRRLQVRFRRHGGERFFSAYTTNISAAGMFIATGSPLPRGSRVLIEVLDPEQSFVLEGQVVHAARVSPVLRQLRDSGMGVRFLTVEELISRILPTAAITEEELPADASEAIGDEVAGEQPGAGPGAGAGEAAGEQPANGPEGAAEQPVGQPPPASTPAATPGEHRRQPQADPATPAAAAAPRAAPPRPPTPAARTGPQLGTESGLTYRMRFPSLPNFLTVFERDIKNGGVFVPTQKPAALHARISIEIHVPAPVNQAARFPGKVVQVTAPAEGAQNLLAGMGVEFIDPERVVRRLDALIYAD